MIFWAGVLQKHSRQGPVVRAKKPAGRDTMGTLFLGAGTLLGVFLVILLFSLLSMAQKADRF
jgi:hypothetical protein